MTTYMKDSSSDCAKTTPQSWSNWTEGFVDEEKAVFKRNLPLVITSSVVTAVYTYTMIRKDVNDSIQHGLLMALATFLGISLVDLLQYQNVVNADGNTPKVIEAVTIPIIYYWINRRQFGLPDLQSEIIITGLISSVSAQLITPFVTDYMDKMDKKRRKNQLTTCNLFLLI